MKLLLIAAVALAPVALTPLAAKDNEVTKRLSDAGVVFSAHDDAGDVRALELPGHPFFLGTLFQPELAGDGTRAHPVIRAFARQLALARTA